MAAVIPAYNESSTLRTVVLGVLADVQRVIVVDDGSSDDTASQVCDLPVQVLRHEKNSGKSRSLMDGFHAALAWNIDAVVTLDADGQHRPRDLPLLLAESARYPSAIVIGSRLHERANIPAARYWANRFANFWISWAAGQHIADSQSGFRVYPTSVLRALLGEMRNTRRFVFESEILIVAASRSIASRAVPVGANYPASGRPSHFRPVRDIALIVLMVARHLLSRGMHLRGLLASLQRSGRVGPEN